MAARPCRSTTAGALVHATHMTDAETQAVARSRATVAICPTPRPTGRRLSPCRSTWPPVVPGHRLGQPHFHLARRGTALAGIRPAPAAASARSPPAPTCPASAKRCWPVPSRAVAPAAPMPASRCSRRRHRALKADGVPIWSPWTARPRSWPGMAATRSLMPGCFRATATWSTRSGPAATAGQPGHRRREPVAAAYRRAMAQLRTGL